LMPIQIDVRDLVARPGSSRTVRVAERVPGLDTELARVPEDRILRVELLVEGVVEGILVSGPVEGVMLLRCARCLKPFDSGFRLDLQELFAPGGTDEAYPLTEGFVDVEPMIRDAVMLAMPFAPLCRPDCLGLCERCGGDRNLGECACRARADPRWSALLEFRTEESDDAASGVRREGSGV
jgi:uncharacterized protein